MTRRSTVLTTVMLPLFLGLTELDHGSNGSNLGISPGFSLQFYAPEYGNLREERRTVYPTAQIGLLNCKVAIKNVSNRWLEIYRPGNSWGDQALSIEIKLSNGTTKLFDSTRRIYFSNFPSATLLLPGDFEFRDVDPVDINQATLVSRFQGMSEFLKSQRGNPVVIKARAHLKQIDEGPSFNKYLWHGSVYSPWTEMSWISDRAVTN